MERRLKAVGSYEWLGTSPDEERREMKNVTWQQLRWELTTFQLKKLAENLKVDISGIAANTQQKKRLAERIAKHCGIVPNAGSQQT